MQTNEFLDREELQQLQRRSDGRALLTVGSTWALIAAAFALAGVWPNPITVLVAMALLGGRQLGLAVVMHDCGHQGLFRRPGVNRFVGRWFAAAPVFADLDGYFRKHVRHHRKAGTEEDPDLGNYRHYAVTRASFRRKILRDLSGRTGIKTLAAGIQAGGWRFLVRPLLIQAVLLVVLFAAGRPWLYLLWIGSYLTFYMLFSRLRQAAEHAVVPDLFDPDPRLHTRTTLPHWWERLFLAPNHVNYHLEHHLMPSVPPYRLGALHRLLRERGAYEQADISHGYRSVVARLTLHEA